jgi:hypothetical protein
MTTKQFHKQALTAEEARRMDQTKRSESTARQDAARILYRLAFQVETDEGLATLMSAARHIA